MFYTLPPTSTPSLPLFDTDTAGTDTMIKQEPLGHDDVQPPVYSAPWLHEPFSTDYFQSPFVDLLADDVENHDALLDDAAAWSTHRPHAAAAAEADEDAVVFDSLVCHEETAAHSYALDGMTSPVATSDMLRFHMRRHDSEYVMAKPVSPRWSTARLDDTMGAPYATCSSHGCNQRASDSDSGRCPRHAGGRLCKTPGCTKNTQSNGLCIRHGGGRRCDVDGCPRGAQARGKCKTHGGGVRCKAPGCVRSSQGSGLCRTHGGGKLCDFPGCKKGTQRHGKCSTHGGARRCRIDGCGKVDRGGGLCGRHKAETKMSDGGDDVAACEEPSATV